MTIESANIARYMRHNAQQFPNRTAIVARTGRDTQGKAIYTTRSFHDLDRESDQLAWGLSAYGLQRGTRVLVMVRTGLPLISLAFALFKVGCVPVLIDPAVGIFRLAHCIAECAPTAMIGIEIAQVARMLFLRHAMRSIHLSVTVGRTWGWHGPTLADLHADIATPYPIAVTRPADPAAILFTTGSTGMPKGVLYEHGMFEAQYHMLRQHYQIEAGEVDMPALPLLALFDAAMGATTALPEINPARPAACDPVPIIELINDQGVTISFGSPTIWEPITHYCIEHNIRLPTLRRVLMAGAPVPTHLHARFQQILGPNADSHTPYGATEALPMTSASGREILAAHAAEAPTAGTCLGRPLPGIDLCIIPISETAIATWSDTLALLPGEVGEITVRGPSVSRHYVERPQAQAQAKIQAGTQVWHRTGDLGRLDAEGRLWFYGRKSQRVQLADRCLYTEPCERVFNQHPAVYRSALVGIQRAGATIPVIIIEPEPGKLPRHQRERNQFISELRSLATQYPITTGITTFLFHPALPVDVRHNAKIFREQLAVWADKQEPR